MSIQSISFVPSPRQVVKSSHRSDATLATVSNVAAAEAHVLSVLTGCLSITYQTKQGPFDK